MSYSCGFCNQTLRSKENLVKHQGTSKKCLQKQETKETNFPFEDAAVPLEAISAFKLLYKTNVKYYEKKGMIETLCHAVKSDSLLTTWAKEKLNQYIDQTVKNLSNHKKKVLHETLFLPVDEDHPGKPQFWTPLVTYSQWREALAYPLRLYMSLWEHIQQKVSQPLRISSSSSSFTMNDVVLR